MGPIGIEGRGIPTIQGFDGLLAFEGAPGKAPRPNGGERFGLGERLFDGLIAHLASFAVHAVPEGVEQRAGQCDVASMPWAKASCSADFAKTDESQDALELFDDEAQRHHDHGEHAQVAGPMANPSAPEGLRDVREAFAGHGGDFKKGEDGALRINHNPNRKVEAVHVGCNVGANQNKQVQSQSAKGGRANPSALRRAFAGNPIF